MNFTTEVSDQLIDYSLSCHIVTSCHEHLMDNLSDDCCFLKKETLNEHLAGGYNLSSLVSLSFPTPSSTHLVLKVLFIFGIGCKW